MAQGASHMGYGDLWKILESLAIELRKRGETIPANVIEDLRSAKTMIQVLKADPARIENTPSIEMYLSNVESYLVFEGHQKFGPEFAEDWLQKLREARKTVRIGEEEIPEAATKFVPSVPKGKKWLRVQITREMPQKETAKLAAECGLTTKMQPDGYMLVSGDEKQIKLFVQKTGEKFQRRKVG